MKTIAKYASKILQEGYIELVSQWGKFSTTNKPYTFNEWCVLHTQLDPDFYRWLFADNTISDFGSNLTDEELEIAESFFSTL